MTRIRRHEHFSGISVSFWFSSSFGRKKQGTPETQSAQRQRPRIKKLDSRVGPAWQPIRGIASPSVGIAVFGSGQRPGWVQSVAANLAQIDNLRGSQRNRRLVVLVVRMSRMKNGLIDT